MMNISGFVLTVFCCVLTNGDDLNHHAFPLDFMFGVATASYQVEGGWNADGKGENIWDRLTHERPELINGNANGNVACDSYHKYKEDVKLLSDLGVSHYRFSLSWSRILPTGFVNKINEAGVNYYKNLIEELWAHNIEPLITLYHWDLPQPLQDAGGWLNDQVIDWYADYARTCFNLFGGSVKFWVTFNEPKQICQQGYGSGTKAPAINSSGIGEYRCAHNLLRAHAKAWHIYDSEFRLKQKGKLGIVIDSDWFQPENSTPEDEAAAETKRQFTHGWFASPLYTGDYPAVMKENIARRSTAQGFSSSRLPAFTAAESQFLKGTVDFLGVNSYTASIVRPLDKSNIDQVGWAADAEVETYQSDKWESSASSWLKVTPWAIRYLTRWIKNTYGNPLMIITENGVSQNDTNLEDDARIYYIQNYLSNLRDAMDDDGVNVFGYTAWSLMDNFEWMRGYTEKFGLYNVDFQSSNRTRKPKKSARYYKQVIKTKCIFEYENCY